MKQGVATLGRRVTAALIAGAIATGTAQAQGTCPAKRNQPLVPTDPMLCAELNDAVRAPAALPLAEYEEILGRFLRGYCHRDVESGWARDKRVRDTGPFVSLFRNSAWQGSDHGVHAPVVIWYSPDAAAWTRANRAEDDAGPGPDAMPMPDGAMLIKEMYPAPASQCANEDPLTLYPSNGAAVMVRDSAASHDGWYWGWFGWDRWTPDWPADPRTNRLANMGFGQYCVNCHASARDNLTFSATRNMAGEAGEPLSYLSQDEALRTLRPAHHAAIAAAAGSGGMGPLAD